MTNLAYCPDACVKYAFLADEGQMTLGVGCATDFFKSAIILGEDNKQFYWDKLSGKNSAFEKNTQEAVYLCRTQDENCLMSAVSYIYFPQCLY